jgi:GAF domain-containing protein
MTDAGDPLDTFAEVARALAHEDDLETTLQRIVDLAVETVPGAAHAAISSARRRRAVTTVASSSALARSIDDVQYETQQGPCLDAIFEREVVEVDDLSSTDRWPGFARRAAGLGVLSMLSFRLFVEDDVAGALNLYNGDPSGFGERSHRLGHVFAAHAALAWDHEREVAGLRTSVESRTLIGQAQGMLMAVHGVSPDDAFGLLREASQRRNIRLRDLAQEVVAAGGFPADQA